MTTIIRGREVTRPSTTPLTSSIFDHATMAENDHFGLSNDTGLWPSYNCLDLAASTPSCPEPSLTEDGEVKEFQFVGWQEAFTFNIYGAVQCSLVGLDLADQKSEVGRVFALGESKAVEQALVETRFIDGGSDHEWDAPTDLTPGSDVTLLTALALLEGYAARVYAGQPTIHMPRAAATVLTAQGALTWTGGKAYTKSGAKVACGGGYDDETMLASGSWDMYATGEVFIERDTDFQVHQGTTTPGFIAYQAAQGGYVEADDPNKFTDNTGFALAERMFRVAVDCFVAKATGTVWA